MVYADPDKVTRRIAKFTQDTTSDEFLTNLEDALQAADNKINNKINEKAVPTPVPDVIKEIAFLFAMARLLDEYAMTRGERNEIAIAWEKEAKEMLENYPEDENPSAKSGQKYTRNNTSLNRPWQGSKTRGRY